MVMAAINLAEVHDITRVVCYDQEGGTDAVSWGFPPIRSFKGRSKHRSRVSQSRGSGSRNYEADFMSADHRSGFLEDGKEVDWAAVTSDGDVVQGPVSEN